MRTEPPGSVEILCAGDWLKHARGVLMTRRGSSAAGDSTGGDAALEAQVLLAHVLQRPRAWLLAHPEAPLSSDQTALLGSRLARLADGEPLPYITGVQEFYGLSFVVSPAVLIPRPETELLVEAGLHWLKAHPTRRRSAEAGIGSGCISVTLSKHIPDLRVLATDRSFEALEVARLNSLRHRAASQIILVQADLLTAASGPFDLVCANLPYIPSAVVETLTVARYEPRMALEAGEDGLREIRALLDDAPRWLAPGGLLLLEIQHDQGERVAELTRLALPGAQVRVLDDLAGLPRLVRVELPEQSLVLPNP